MNLMQYISDNDVPQIDRRIADGLVGHYMENIIPFIDNQVKAICLSSGTGLKLVSTTMATPEEAFSELSAITRSVKGANKQKSQEMYEISESDFCMVKFNFTFNDEPLRDLYVMVPYVRHGCFIKIRGSLYTISPVIGDPAITVTEKPGLFLRLAKFKFNISRQSKPTIVRYMDKETGEIIEKVTQGYFAYANLYKTSVNITPSVRGKTTFGHYLFCKFGVVGAFKRYLNVDIKLGYQDTINFDELDPKEWIIFEAFKGSDNGAKRGPVMLAAKTMKYDDPLLADMVRAFHYVVSLPTFTERLLPEYLQDNDGTVLDSAGDPIAYSVEDECRLWRILLGHLTNTSELGEQRLLIPVTRHFDAINGYIDIISLKSLAMSGCEIDPSPENQENWFFDLMAHLMETYGNRLISADLSNMYGKHVGILREVCFPITDAVTRATFEICNFKGTSDKLDAAFARRSLGRKLFPRASEDNMRRSNFKAASSASLVNGNKLFRSSTTIVMQDDSTTGGKNSKKADSEDKRMHISLAECASAFAARKNIPTGHGQFNPLIKIDYNSSRIIQNPDLKEETDLVQSMLRRED